MPSLVSVEDARNHMQVDGTAHDAWFNIFIPAISGAVLSWLKDDWRAYEHLTDSNGDPLEDSNGDVILKVDSNGEPIVLPVVQAAVLVELASQFRFREGVDVAAVPSHWGHGYVLSAGPTSLLTALRRSTIK